MKYITLILCSLVLVSCSSTVQSKKTPKDSNKNNETKVTQGSTKQDIKLKDASAYNSRAILKADKRVRVTFYREKLE
jgi:uncharacterized protein YcfL